jgi:hypothetical protein
MHERPSSPAARARNGADRAPRQRLEPSHLFEAEVHEAEAGHLVEWIRDRGEVLDPFLGRLRPGDAHEEFVGIPHAGDKAKAARIGNGRRRDAPARFLVERASIVLDRCPLFLRQQVDRREGLGPGLDPGEPIESSG